jgi:hypothetical protein
MAVPTRQTAEDVLDQWNRALRASPLYTAFLQRHRINPNRVKLSRSQQAALESELARAGMPVPSGMHIDQGGNLNQQNTLVKKAATTAAIGAAAATGLGAVGIGPLASLGGATAGTAAGTTAATSAGLSSWLTPALAYGAPAVTGLIGARMQGNAERDAAALQHDYLTRALDVEKENEQYRRGQRADYLGRLKPYSDAGGSAVQRASALLTTSRYRPEGVTAGMPSGPLVALQDARGEIRQVPASDAERYIQLGARRV